MSNNLMKLSSVLYTVKRLLRERFFPELSLPAQVFYMKKMNFMYIFDLI